MNLPPEASDAVRALLRPDILLSRIRIAVARLTLTTYPTIDGVDVRARRIVQDPLISQLREAVRPSQSGRLQGAATGAPAPLSVSAYDLLTEVESTIAGWYESATDNPPTGTAEQMLAEWFEAFVRAHQAGEVIDAMLENYAARVASLRYRIQEYFDPPRISELPVCPNCAYTHCLETLDKQLVQRRCLQLRLFDGGAVAAACRWCGAQWEGGVTSEGAWGTISDLQKGIAELVADMRRADEDSDNPSPLFRLAPISDDLEDENTDPDALAEGVTDERQDH